ncbi:MAG: hypothetical protein ACYTGL_17245 [Planctomycetota bacterium]|jgi:hypothetical protein
MSNAQASSDKPEDSFLSSTGIGQSSVIMTGGILILAFLFLTILGRESTTPPESRTDETVAAQSVEPETDIAGSAAATDQ